MIRRRPLLGAAALAAPAAAGAARAQSEAYPSRAVAVLSGCPPA